MRPSDLLTAKQLGERFSVTAATRYAAALELAGQIGIELEG